MAKIIPIFSKKCTKEHPVGRDKSLKAKTFLNDIIRPALRTASHGLWSKNAEVLLLGTALAESNLDSFYQWGDGPGLSLFQIEADTYIDVVKYIERKSDKKEAILAALYMDMFPRTCSLAWNMRLSVLIARMIYWRRPEPLPHADDIEGMAAYWKEHFNTVKGKGTTEHFIKQWRAHDG